MISNLLKGGDIIIALYILLGLIVIVAILLSIRVGLHIIYEDDLNVYLKVLFIKYSIYPAKKKKFNIKKYNKKEKKKKSQSDIVIKEKSEKEKNPSLLDKISFIKEILSVFLKAFSKHLKVNLKKLHIIVATPDAAQTAITYGAISGVTAGIVELIDSYTNLKALNEDAIIVKPDFTSEKSEVSINISLSISVLGALITLGKTLWKSILLKNKQ